MQNLDSFSQYTNDVRAHDYMQSTSLQQTLILENLSLVIYIARRYLGKSELSFLDLIQEGNLGLIEAAARYREEEGLFKYFCSQYIEGYILNATAKESSSLSMSREKKRLAKRVQQLRGEESGLTAEQIAERLEISVKNVLELMSIHLEVVSLNRPMRQDEEVFTLADTLEAEHSDPETIAMAQITCTSIQQLLHVLTSEERKVIVLRFGLNGEEENPSTAHIATRLHKTKQYVQTLEERALLKLRMYAQSVHIRENVA